MMNKDALYLVPLLPRLLYMWGGPSDIDLFDMKPNAHSELRPPFKEVSTKVPGVRITELMPELRKVVDKIASEPVEDAVSPSDVSAIMFHLLGRDPKTHFHDSLGRPYPLSEGRVLNRFLGT